MIAAGLDLESTGFLKPEHKIVELHIQKWDCTDMNAPVPLERKTWRIDPERSIDAKAFEVHRISNDDLKGCPRFAEVADEIMRYLNGVDLVVAHNGDEFDRPFVRMELEAAGKSLTDYDHQRWFDTMQNGRWADPWGKVPTLGQLCWACDIPYDPALAHAADYDVEVMMKAFFFGVRSGFFSLPT